MRYLRMLSNSVLAAVLATSYLVVLFLQLNPRPVLSMSSVLPIVMTVGFYYAVHLTAIFYVLLVVWQLVAREPFSPAWISVSVLARLATFSAAAGALLMWANLETFGVALEPESTSAMLRAAAALVICAACFAAIAAGHKLMAPRLSWMWAFALVIVAGASVAMPVVLRTDADGTPYEPPRLSASGDPAPSPPSARVTVIAIDGGSLEFVTSATAEGRLANFGRVLDRGAAMHLATLHPTSAEAVWSAVATGKLPYKNGVRSTGLYRVGRTGEVLRLLPDYCFSNTLVRFGFLTEEPYTSATFRARPLWSVLSLQGRSAGVINWPLTYPAPAVHGYVVSDRYSKVSRTVAGLVDQSLLYPEDLRPELLQMQQDTGSGVTVPARVDTVLEERYQLPGRDDRDYRRMARTLGDSRPADVTLTRYQSLDAIGHYFLRYATPSAFGDVTEEERRRFGAVLEAHYGLIDDAIGRAIDALRPEDLLLVVSGYGMEPLSLGKRIVERVIGDPNVNGTHESAPDGFLLAYGASVVNGRLPRASVVDIVPTVLYFLGLPVGRDMDGYARTDLFRSEFTSERPITFIPTYDR